MKTQIEIILLKEIEILKQKVNRLEGVNVSSVPIYQYSRIRDNDLNELFEIEKNLDETIFNQWFNNEIEVDVDTQIFLENLIKDNRVLIESYNEEDLKINVISPILSRVKFKSFENKIRDFYEASLIYKTDKFILKGTADFMVSEGLVESKKPYFFIQEFKRSEEYGNPRPQLLAELISAVELNDWQFIKGAYIIGGNWHFAILEKLERHKYQYFISKNFDATKVADMSLIYKNLMFVKHEIMKMLAK
ncbi:MAG: hypothetical protein KAG06_03730 [Methylococcales bacterium]|nr:hypothetical protein [Methylococcales bacterium]